MKHKLLNPRMGRIKIKSGTYYTKIIQLDNSNNMILDLIKNYN